MTEPAITIHTPALTTTEAAALLTQRAKEHKMSVTPVKAPPATPGWQTTEFWVTVLVTVGGLAATMTNNLPPRYAAIASTVSVVAYSISRGLAKH